MVLGYAFIDKVGVRYGKPSASPPSREFPYVPESGPFAGQRLTVHASTWDGLPSGTWLHASESWGCFATTEVEALLGMDRPLGDPRAG